ncbi:AfsR/SARP family transcriptional regulator [Myceligenerans indicum]|uniref:AfsR/SARP family transcriptional regulator n=1 Tax=Myceligenerans indicum TaxID=2593663 RepID=UPI001A925342|nr:hypothetical protein [Myceligenerans indicum]
MRFRVLGPLVATGLTTRGTISAAMPRQVLAVLLLHHGRTVAVDTLVDELWGSHPPRPARRCWSLTSYTSYRTGSGRTSS